MSGAGEAGGGGGGPSQPCRLRLSVTLVEPVASVATHSHGGACVSPRLTGCSEGDVVGQCTRKFANIVWNPLKIL